jgi:predicted DNA-binding transcriptional regulator AlpA
MTNVSDLAKGLLGNALADHKQAIAQQKQASQSHYGFQAKAGWNIPFLRPKQLAAQLGISEKTLERMRKDGSGPPFIKLRGNQIRYPIRELEAWIATRTTKHTPPGAVLPAGKEGE